MPSYRTHMASDFETPIQKRAMLETETCTLEALMSGPVPIEHVILQGSCEDNFHRYMSAALGLFF